MVLVFFAWVFAFLPLFLLSRIKGTKQKQWKLTVGVAEEQRQKNFHLFLTSISSSLLGSYNSQMSGQDWANSSSLGLQWKREGNKCSSLYFKMRRNHTSCKDILECNSLSSKIWWIFWFSFSGERCADIIYWNLGGGFVVYFELLPVVFGKLHV